MTHTREETMPCDRCGKQFRPEELDSKPSAPDAANLTVAEQSALEFDRHECRDCYGPGFSEL
jgi:hypothetical protein